MGGGGDLNTLHLTLHHLLITINTVGFESLCSALLESLITPLQERIEDWKKTANTLDKEHARGEEFPHINHTSAAQCPLHTHYPHRTPQISCTLAPNSPKQPGHTAHSISPAQCLHQPKSKRQPHRTAPWCPHYPHSAPVVYRH